MYRYESNKVLTLTTNTCSGVYDGCSSLIKKVISIAEAPSDSCDTGAKNLGLKNCQDLICSNLNYLADYNPTYGGSIPIPNPDSVAARFASTLASIAGAAHPGTGQLVGRIAARALGVRSAEALAGTSVSSVTARPTPPPRPPFTILYDPSGYDAYGKGCSVTGSCPKSSGSKFAKIGGVGGLIAIVVASLLAVVLIAVVVSRMSRPNRPDPGLLVSSGQEYALLVEGSAPHQEYAAYPPQPQPGQSLNVQSVYGQPQPQHPAFK
jgi:hypothetical protein